MVPARVRRVLRPRRDAPQYAVGGRLSSAVGPTSPCSSSGTRSRAQEARSPDGATTPRSRTASTASTTAIPAAMCSVGDPARSSQAAASIPFGYNTPDVVADLAATQVNGTVRTGKSTLAMLDFRAWNSIYELPAGRCRWPSVPKRVSGDRPQRPPPRSRRAISSSVGAHPSMNASRDVWAVFAEANVPLLRNLEAIVALRFDHYSDGLDDQSQGVARWQPVRTLLFRGSAAPAFARRAWRRSTPRAVVRRDASHE